MIRFKCLLTFFFVWMGMGVSVKYQAFNISCLNSSYLITNSTPSQLNIPTFSRVDIQIDLRHLPASTLLTDIALNLYITNTDSNQNYSEPIPLHTSTTAYSFYAGNNVILSAQYTITDTSQQLTLTRSYLFANSLSAWVRPPQPLTEQQKSFLFVITSKDYVGIPYNVPSSQNALNFNGYFLTQEEQLANMTSRQTTVASYSQYWNAFSQLALPFLPYFSNCENDGSYLHFSQMIHNSSECSLYGYNSTPIKEFNFGSSAIADTCKITRKCIYDETSTSTHEYPVWSTLTPTSKYLFYVTASEYAYPYSPVPSTDFQKAQLVQCKIKTSAGDNSTNKFPLKTKITMGYYQQSQTLRTILRCQVQFSLYSQSTPNFEYQLQINFAPMNHTNILLQFGFRWYIYILVFIIIGVISNIQFVIFWIYHILTTVKQKATFRIAIYLRMVKEILKGYMFAVFIAIFLTFLVQLVMNGTIFGYVISSQFNSLWDYLTFNHLGYLASTNLKGLRKGRMGFSYIFISLYLAYHLSPLLIGKQRKGQTYKQYQILGQKFSPWKWNRGKVIFGMYVIALSSSGFLFFTFSTLFNANIWTIIVMMQIAQMVLEEVLNSLYDDVLPCIPMKLSVGVLAYLATMGAIDLYYFILGYMVDVGIATIERAYLSLIQEKMSKFVQEKNQELHKFYINLLNDQQEQQQHKSHQNNSLVADDELIMIEMVMNKVQILDEEVGEEYNQQLDYRNFQGSKSQTNLRSLFVKAMTEKNQSLDRIGSKRKKGSGYANMEGESNIDQAKQNKKFQLLNDSSVGMVQYWLQPIAVFMLWITYNSSNILSNYTIAPQNCILYLLSSIILAISYQLNVFIIFHVLELYFNFDYKNLIQQMLNKFQQKTTFWITDSQKWQLLDGVDTKMKACSSYCLSSQMFFVVSLYTLLMYLFIIGFNTIISAQFNVLKDPFIIPIALFWLTVIFLLEKVLRKIVRLLNIWDYAYFQTGNRISQEPDQSPLDGSETRQVLNKSSMDSSSIRFTFKQINEPSPNSRQQKLDKRQVLQAKLKTPTFERDDFRIEYAIKNKDYVRTNIQKILPLITKFPDNDTKWLGRGESDSLPLARRKQAKNIDPAVGEFVSSWLKRVESNRSRRQDDGIERQRVLKKCNFCFKTWAIYYGYDGICLQCSRKIFNKHIKED